MTELCDLAYKYGSDKCPKIKHHYTPYYYKLFKDRRESIKKVLEIGIGNKEQHGMRHVPRSYVTGASLRMWRDFFPNAQVYGIDNDQSCMFEDERITTIYRTQSRVVDLSKVLMVTGRDIDIVIDDGSHYTSDQVFTCSVLMPLLKDDVIYIIEDMNESREVQKRLPAFKTKIIQFKESRTRDDKLLIVRK